MAKRFLASLAKVSILIYRRVIKIEPQNFGFSFKEAQKLLAIFINCVGYRGRRKRKASVAVASDPRILGASHSFKKSIRAELFLLRATLDQFFMAVNVKLRLEWPGSPSAAIIHNTNNFTQFLEEFYSIFRRILHNF